MSDWQQIGAWRGGTVSAVAISPNFNEDSLMLAATGAGLYRSTDGGEQWARAVHGFDDPGAITVAFAPADSDLVLASSEQGRLYRSDNAGATWAEVPNWAGLGIITALTLSPNYPHDHTFFVATPEGVFRTLDDGVAWQEASFGLLDLDVLCLACAPDFAESDVLWAGTALGGFFRSRNGGRAWRESGVGLPDCAIQVLAISPNFATDHTLLVGTETDGVYLSLDGGASWQPSGQDLAGLSVNCLHISVDARRAAGYRVVAGTDAGIYYSDNRAASWTSTESGEFLALDLAATTESMRGTILAATYQEGIYLSNDNGHNWRPTGHNSNEIVAHAPPVITTTPSGALYAVDANGIVAQSPDSGANWQDVTMNDALAPVVAIVGGVSDVLYMATVDGLLLQHYPQTDTWQAMEAPDDEMVGLALAVGAHGAHHLLVTTGLGQVFLCTLDEAASDVEEPDKARWQQLTCPWTGEVILYLDFSPWYAEDETLCAVTAQGNTQGNFDVNVWQSTDRGVAWESLATFETEVPAVLTHQVHDVDSRAILLATQNRIIRLYYTLGNENDDANGSANGEGELAVDQYFFESGNRITALAATTGQCTIQTLYAATTQGIVVSTDGGQQWDTRWPLPGDRPVVALLVEQTATAPSQLMAVTLGGEVWGMGLK